MKYSSVNEIKSYVYWLHLPEHNDIRKEGYIGTAYKPQDRFEKHKWFAKKGTHYNPHLQSAFGKYGENIQLSEIVYNTENYCYEKEAALRPTPNIGWNISAGGRGGGAWSEEMKQERSKKYKGLKRSVEVNKQLSDTVKEKYKNGWAPAKGKKRSEEWKKERSRAIQEQWATGKRDKKALSERSKKRWIKYREEIIK